MPTRRRDAPPAARAALRGPMGGGGGSGAGMPWQYPLRACDEGRAAEGGGGGSVCMCLGVCQAGRVEAC